VSGAPTLAGLSRTVLSADALVQDVGEGGEVGGVDVVDQLQAL
jgi:hypothetical protein